MVQSAVSPPWFVCGMAGMFVCILVERGTVGVADVLQGLCICQHTCPRVADAVEIAPLNVQMCMQCMALCVGR